MTFGLVPRTKSQFPKNFKKKNPRQEKPGAGNEQ